MQENGGIGLSDFVEFLNEWEKIEELCREVVGSQPILVDASGKILFGRTHLPPFCALIHSATLGYLRCQKCYREECFSQRALQSGYTVFTCHAGLNIFAVPLVVEEPVAVVVGGGVLVGELNPGFFQEVAARMGLPPVELREKVELLEEATPEKLLASAQILKVAVQALAGLMQRHVNLLKQLDASMGMRETETIPYETDPLTGLPSKKFFFSTLDSEISRAKRYQTPISVVCFDIDRLREINRDWGYEVGDEILRRVAALLKENRRQSDLASRLEEDEFGLLLPQTTQAQAYRMAERLLSEIKKPDFVEKVIVERCIAVTAGVASFSERVSSAQEMLERARQALTEAKAEKGNPIRIFAPGSKSSEHGGRRRVVVTGMGLITPYGVGKDLFWENAIAGKSAIRRITFFDASDIPSQIGGQVPDFDPLEFMDSKAVKRSARSSWLAVAAAKMAVEDSALELEKEDPARIGVLIGSAVGGLEFGEDQAALYMKHGARKVSPYLAIVIFAGAVSSEVSLHLGLKGPGITVSTGCSGGSDAIGYALQLTREGKADIVIAGGVEAPLRPLIFTSFTAIRALSTRNDEPEKASRPFDLKRDGFVMSEGVGVLILEELQHALRRGAPIYGEVVGYAATGDAFHMTRPAPDGAEAARAMELALADARIKPEQVDYINAHGSSTPLNDKIETMIIKKILGPHAYKVPISATKSLIGHPIGAASAIELAACLLSMKHKILHPTINYEFPDPECDLDYVPNEARPAEVKVALSNSFGFGGKNSCLVVRSYEV